MSDRNAPSDAAERLREYGTERGGAAADRAAEQLATTGPVTPAHRAVAAELAERLTAGLLPSRERLAAVDDPEVAVEVFLPEEVDA